MKKDQFPITGHPSSTHQLPDLFETKDGSHSIFSVQHGVSYHSKHGAIQETEHVFINAGLRMKAVLKKELAVLEIGFGTGLNAFMTYLEAQKRGLNVEYIGVEAFPIGMDTVALLNYPTQLKVEKTAPIFFQMHQIPANSPTLLNDSDDSSVFEFTRLEQTFETLDFNHQFDVIYYDAFAPSAQPELWEAPILQKMYDALKTDGVLVTYCAKGVFKRTLKAIGFTVEPLPGPPGKREMTRALKL